ncbi:MAG: hypothetical protein AAF480_01840 [Actinomycetota bacterium]
MDRDDLIDAIRDSWCRETSAAPDEWHESNPARGQCDVSSFVLWEHLGGDLVLGEVFVDGTKTEHHYWNRVGDEDIDVTGDQFTDAEEVREHSLLTTADIAARRGQMREEVQDRISRLRVLVDRRLASLPSR